MSIEYLEQIGSTNEYIKENAASLLDFDAVYTLCQTNGRGRMGRNWSTDGGIACSVLVKECKNPILLPICAAVALAAVLRDAGIEGVGIKWPNDIVVCGKKLCGILCEGFTGGYIVGIGINNKQTSDYYAQNELPFATSIKMLGYSPLVESLIVESVVNELKKSLKMPLDDLIGVFSSDCVNLGKMVKILNNGGEFVAYAVGISNDGGLIIECDGKRQTVISGEVSVRGIYGYTE